MLDSASGLADAFKGTASQLGQLGRDLDATAGNAVTTLNDLATGLARINDGLSRATPGSTGSAQLLDQRDQILEQMSALSDRSDARRVGKEYVRTCRSRWSPGH